MEAGEGGSAEGVPVVARRQLFKWPQNSADAHVSGLGKPSGGSEGKTQKETCGGEAAMGGLPKEKAGRVHLLLEARSAEARQQRSRIYCDKMNSPQVAHPAANFSSYLLCE